MRVGGDYHPKSAEYNRPLAAFPCARLDFYLDISTLGSKAQGATGTVKATRRSIQLVGVGTDGHVVRVSDGANDVDFELDDDGVIAGTSEVLVEIAATPERTAYNLAQAIASNAGSGAPGALRATIDVQHIGDKVILRNAPGALTTQLTTSSAAASFDLDTYLVYNPEDFRDSYSSIPNYQTPGVRIRGPFAEKDTDLSFARVIMYGLDVYDNPIESVLDVKTNSHSGAIFYFSDVFTRVDQIRVYNFGGNASDTLAVGYPLPFNYPFINPEPGAGNDELARYSISVGAARPYTQALTTMQPKGYSDTPGHEGGDAPHIDFDTTDLNALNVADGDEIWIADEDGGVLFTIAAAPAAATDIPIGTDAVSMAANMVATVNAYFTDKRFEARQLTHYSANLGRVHVFGSELTVLELTRDDPPALIADTDFSPKRWVDLDATGLHVVLGVTDPSMRDGDLVVLRDSTGEDVMEFDDDAAVVAGHNAVTIGANGLLTLADLVTQINGIAAPNTGFKAIDAGGVTLRCLLVRGDTGGGEFYLSSQSANMQFTRYKVSIVRRVPPIRTSIIGIYPQAVGHYDEATGAPFNIAVFTSYAWDTMDMSFDPYGFPYRGGNGAAAGGAPRAALLDTSLPTSPILNLYASLWTGALAGTYMLQTPDPHARAARGMMIPDTRRNRRAGDLKEYPRQRKVEGGRFRTSATSCPPHVDMPTGLKGGRR